MQVRAPVETQAAPGRSSLSSVSSVRTSELRLQSKNVSDGSTEWHAFSAGTVTQPSHTVLVFVPTVADLNAIKAKQQLAISAESSFFVISSDFVSDLNGNAVVSIGNSSALLVSQYTADTTQPKLTSFDLDMNAGVLRMVFGETVDAATLQPAFVILQDNQTEGVDFVLTGGARSTTDSTDVSINITAVDLNEILLWRVQTAPHSSGSDLPR